MEEGESERTESRDKRVRENVASFHGTDTFAPSLRKTEGRRNAAVLLRQLRRARRTPYRTPTAYGLRRELECYINGISFSTSQRSERK